MLITIKDKHNVNLTFSGEIKVITKIHNQQVVRTLSGSGYTFNNGKYKTINMTINKLSRKDIETLEFLVLRGYVDITTEYGDNYYNVVFVSSQIDYTQENEDTFSTSLEFENKIPFKEVYFTGIIRDEIGRKMSKSLGNAPDTLGILDKYGADAVRFSLMYNTSQGQDILFSEKLLEMGSTFANKVWNASKFVISNLEGFKEDISILDLDFKLEDQWILSKLQNAAKRFNEEMEEYNIDSCAKIAYEFFRNDFCDWYVEIAKTRIYGVDADNVDRQSAQWVLRHILDNGLRLLHPFMPFITEEVWQKIKVYGESIMLSDFPREDKSLINIKAENDFEYLEEVIGAIRNIRAENNVSPAKKISIIIDTEDDGERDIVLNNPKILDKLANVEKIDILTELPKMSGFRVVGNSKIYVSLEGLIDIEKEVEKLNKEIEKVQKELDRTLNKLSNEQFVSKAPQAVIDKEKGIQAELKSKLKKLQDNIKIFKN